ncbi:G-protein subunit alpha 9 [Cavenderia fasciculata]|uniref:G-protein subunit alpha 9 n=1 Tax=Cavenderia fasciculata TaxID=261658 RepID=F4Q1U8_CACFS|nr:G-protein subunit alpha 9 [Cavenderia fasciculata]EGG17968.1 G-protein subunit alpha 9 [Cavenderia fasciculata]|eukprot:XP_004356860.1 G-protein subunit alpha 9 [Cavenderia fasciculata]
MGCGGSIMSKSSLAIDKDLANEKKSMDREIKILLLGAGDSGKSTIAKQMRYIHTRGFSNDEVKNYSDIMQSNVLQCVQLLARNLENYDIQVAPELVKEIEYFKDINPYELPLEDHMVKSVVAIWKDAGIQQLYEKRNEFNLLEVAQYCLDSVERISADGYIPTQEDILKCRQRTTGMKETVFTVEQVRFRLLDVGGQKNERRKWMHYFEDVKTIIFCVALGDYNMNLVEDGATNRMEDSLKLWKEIIGNPYFKGTSFVLFLNKNDLFREKVVKDSLANYFPDYSGGLDYERGLEFIRGKYLQMVPPSMTVVAHVTTATDTENISVVFDAVRRTIINQILKIHF